ncbi:hypothetical protein ARMGADRAFT_1032220 [Armillaria gallica]|uniref:Uncharacterized protein n=1 Tax=Armillaria gallica TaxID=47427 RepID=A0A2H3DTC4_ARMGA|nr:hypothetical protein ARMGADRAFT_1032220 [Armillaria gallica]
MDRVRIDGRDVDGIAASWRKMVGTIVSCTLGSGGDKMMAPFHVAVQFRSGLLGRALAAMAAWWGKKDGAEKTAPASLAKWTGPSSLASSKTGVQRQRPHSMWPFNESSGLMGRVSVAIAPLWGKTGGTIVSSTLKNGGDKTVAPFSTSWVETVVTIIFGTLENGGDKMTDPVRGILHRVRGGRIGSRNVGPVVDNDSGISGGNWHLHGGIHGVSL